MFSCQKTFRKQTEKQVGTIKSLKFSSKKYELIQIESIFLQNLKNELIHDMLKEIVDSQDIIKQIIYGINQKIEKFIILMTILYLMCF